MMIDGALIKPFFARNKKNEIIGSDSIAYWHNESKGMILIDNYYKKVKDESESKEGEENKFESEEEEDYLDYENEEELEQEYNRQLALQEKKKNEKQIQKNNSNEKKYSFEIDFEYFIKFFWPVFKSKKGTKLSPDIVWTEIYSYIKGSDTSHTYQGWYIPYNIYINLENNIHLTKNDRIEIHNAFSSYELWKLRKGGYDMMDVVNYALVQMKYVNEFINI